MDYNTIVEANKLIKTTPIKNKDYAEVNQRVKAFRFLFPAGSITTELVSDDGEKCIFRATVADDEGKVLGTGTAFELKSSSFINKSSYIENCETSAVGRALAWVGLGVDASIASYEEVGNAIENQNKKPEKKEEKEVKPIPQMQEESKAPEQEMTTEKAQAQGAYPSREAMLECAKAHYPNGSKSLEALLKTFKVDSIEKASTAQLMVVWNKYGNK
ncbi:MAG: hypothetical protein J6M44_00860 [Butyrivibrio sp.]|nr:hypothetical protein [Butyrivibrio sp.]